MPQSFVVHGLFGTTTHDVVKGMYEKVGRCHVDAGKRVSRRLC